MTLRFLNLLCALLATAAPAAPQEAEWKDPSPHAVRLGTVEEGVQLEVLDWGGSGPALVLPAGGWSHVTAHQHDDMGPSLASRYRVLSLI